MATKKEKDKLVILELEVQNIKRLISVKIVPNGNVVEISGKNEAGKTTALDCIQYAIEGKQPFSGKKMLKNGQDKGKIRLIMGENKDNPLYTVERVFTEKGDYLKLTAPDGSPIKKGQELLDTFFADNALEVGNFVNLPAQKQLDQLLKVVAIPFVAEDFSKIVGAKVESNGNPLGTINGVCDSIYKEREELGRKVKGARASFEAIAIPEGKEDTEPVDIQAIIKEKERLQEIVLSNQKTSNARDMLADDLKEHEEKLAEMKEDLAALQERIKQRQALMVRLTTQLARETKEVESLEDPDFTEVEQTIANANEINRIASQVQRKKESSAIFIEAQKAYDDLSTTLKDIKQYRLDILSKADFPLKGMSISEEGFPTFKGVQISNKTISTSRGIKIETAIAQKQNPRLRSILIRQGNDLDKKTREVLENFAKQENYQIWIEKVAEEAEENSFFISNGELAN